MGTGVTLRVAGEAPVKGQSPTVKQLVPTPGSTSRGRFRCCAGVGAAAEQLFPDPSNRAAAAVPATARPRVRLTEQGGLRAPGGGFQ